ncbi:peptidoglycan DD-metalloendopeptidase family protein [Streptomyces sp. NPDC053048]|uniref:peptidoglycan DD-metalloendopeptidase family protein n=1 Tax=Streptomyces sp. NPDC053048 TaxID=3365694 RepID=UPI0037D6E771
MNDRHPQAGPAQSVPAPDASYGHGHYTSYEQQASSQGHAGYDGYGTTGQWDTSGQWGTSGHWDTSGGQWGVTGQTQTWDFSGYDLGGQDATGQHFTGQQHTGHQHTGRHDSGHHDTGHHDSGQWNTASAASGWGQDTGAWSTAGPATGSYDTVQWDTGSHHQAWDASGQYPAAQDWNASGQDWNTGPSGQWDISAQQTQAWDTSAYAAMDESPAAQHTPTLMVDLSGADLGQIPAQGQGEAPDVTARAQSVANAETRAMLIIEEPEAAGTPESGPDDEPEHLPADVPAQARPYEDDAPGAPGHGHGRASRRKGAPAPTRAGYRPRRKALLTVAVPSVAVMGVAGIAAASVMTGGEKGTPKTTTAAASAPDTSVKLSAANSKLDTQLAGLSRGADDFASRANRTQERIDLKARQEEERKRKAEEAAKKERERPKFALPVAQHGLSAMYGQAGVNWMSAHTGIDFPVAYGTPVMAATDGTVRTQYNVAYGNMAIVTSADGTETWYCHLSSTKIRSGPVKAGDVIAYSGNSGNSTGPHLHFEVRPGGSAVDPLTWLRSHGYDPT